MDDRYELVGCIDFGTDAFAISVPILQKRGSNYIYIPKTDNFFTVLDFYEVPDLGYAAAYLSDRHRAVRIGDKTPVPILQDGFVYVVNPEWNEAQIRSRLPGLRNEAVKAFLSLRSRMAVAPAVDELADIQGPIDDLLSHPVRSRYWISKFSALVRSAFERGRPSRTLIRRFEDSRKRWLERFAARSSLKMVQDLLDTPNLSRLRTSEVEQVMLQRFERVVLARGIYVPRVELQAFSRMFPVGIFEALRSQTGGLEDYWRRRRAIADVVMSQVERVVMPEDYSQRRLTEPSRWSGSELAWLLLFFDTVAGDDTALDHLRQMLFPLFDACREEATFILSNRYELTRAVFGLREPTMLVGYIVDVLDLQKASYPVSQSEWIVVLGKILDLYRKLIIVSKIVRPHTRKMRDEDIAFEGIDYTLLEAIKAAVATNSVAPLRGVLKPNPSSI